MKEHKFNVMCPGALFMETAQSPPEHEKWCVDVSQPGRTGMHYVTRRSHRMQKHRFIVTCPGVLFVETVPVPSEKKDSVTMFRGPAAPESTM
jgi:hypothetical protein